MYNLYPALNFLLKYFSFQHAYIEGLGFAKSTAGINLCIKLKHINYIKQFDAVIDKFVKFLKHSFKNRASKLTTTSSLLDDIKNTHILVFNDTTVLFECEISCNIELLEKSHDKSG